MRRYRVTDSVKDDLLYLPPDDDLRALAKAITAKLESGRVDFYLLQKVGVDTKGYAIIFQSGSKRMPIQLRGCPTEGDIEDIVSGHQAWAGNRASAPLYSTELPDHGVEYI